MKRLMILKQLRKKTSIKYYKIKDQVECIDEFKKNRTELDIKTTDKDVDPIRTLSCAFI